jgi:hypothetical protein
MTPDTTARTHRVEPRWPVIVSAGLAAGFAMVLLAFFAVDDRGESALQGFTALSAEVVGVLYWVLFALCAICALLAIRFAWRRVGHRGRIAIGADHLVGPREEGSTEERIIPYALVMGMELEHIEGERYLHLALPDGKYTIAASALASDAAFDELRALLAAQLAPPPRRASPPRSGGTSPSI